MSAPVVPPADTERVERVHAPPEPPQIDHRIELSRLQWVGVPLLMIVPALALAGVFDPGSVVVRREIGSLAVRTDTPRSIRQNRAGIVEIELENRGDEPVGAEVAISPEYLADCVAIEMTPAPHRAWAARVARIAPGERARVHIELEGEGAGFHEGVIRVRESSGREARIPVRTFVFP